MAVRKLSNLYLPPHFRLMYQFNNYWTYNTSKHVEEERVDRRLAQKLINEQYVIDKWTDGAGRTFWKPNPKKCDRLGPVQPPTAAQL